VDPDPTLFPEMTCDPVASPERTAPLADSTARLEGVAQVDLAVAVGADQVADDGDPVAAAPGDIHANPVPRASRCPGPTWVPAKKRGHPAGVAEHLARVGGQAMMLPATTLPGRAAGDLPPAMALDEITLPAPPELHRPVWRARRRY